MINRINGILFLCMALCLAKAQNYEASLNSYIGKSGLKENVILIKLNEKIIDSLTVLSGVERDFSFGVINDRFFYTFKMNSDVETAQTTFYLFGYKIQEKKLEVMSKIWLKKSFEEAQKYKIYFSNDSFNFEYKSSEYSLFFARKLAGFKVECLRKIDKKFRNFEN